MCSNLPQEVSLYGSIAEYSAAQGIEPDADLAQLVDAELRSEQSLEDVRHFILDKFPGVRGIDVVAFGSLARREWTDQSDFDYLVIVHTLEAGVDAIRGAQKVAEAARGRLEASEPGATGMFGAVISAPELIARIGLETDTNQTLTRRLLVLQESVSLYNSTEHDRLVQDIFERYLVEYRTRTKVGVARFLLNDVIRYWRTVAVDYQAKNWNRTTDDGWGLRYLKLRISRKLAFAGTLAPLVGLAAEGLPPTTESLHARFQPAPLARLASLHGILHSSGRESLRECLRVAGRFNRKLNAVQFRQEAASVSSLDGSQPSEFAQMLDDSVLLQGNLNEIFFGVQSPLKEVSQKYLVF